jgi:hypothetical protein
MLSEMIAHRLTYAFIRDMMTNDLQEMDPKPNAEEVMKDMEKLIDQGIGKMIIEFNMGRMMDKE